MEQNPKTLAVVGYRRDEQRTFQLRAGEPLPKGWYNSAAKAASRPHLPLDEPKKEDAPEHPAPPRPPLTRERRMS